MPAFAAQSTLFGSAEGCGGVGHHPAVKSDHAGLQVLGDTQSGGEVACVHVGHQSVLGVVCGADCGIEVGEAHDRGDRSEDLLTQDACAVGHGVENRWRVVPAGPIQGTAAGSDGRTTAHRVGDKAIYGDDGVRVDQRAELSRFVVARPDPQPRHRFGQPGGELVGHRVVDVEAVGRGARFAAVAHLGDHRPGDGSVEVGVGQHQERGVAAELHRAAHDPIRGAVQQRPGRPRSSR